MLSDKIENLYVDLDALLDTRLATLGLINEEAATIALATNYHERQSDIFPFVDNEHYKQLYKDRNLITLKKAVCTNMVLLLRDIISDITEQAACRPYYDGVCVMVNIYPYNLSKEEATELERAISVWINGIANVITISVNREDLTPLYCKNTFAMMVMYEYEYWLNYHAENFKIAQLPSVYLFAPAIYFNKVPDEEEMQKLMEENNHPLLALETLVLPLINLKLIDVSYFSILNKKEFNKRIKNKSKEHTASDA